MGIEGSMRNAGILAQPRWARGPVDAAVEVYLVFYP
jgi:hypothetical protein